MESRFCVALVCIPNNAHFYRAEEILLVYEEII